MGEVNDVVISLLKDVRDYFVLQDTLQERAKISPTPKMQEKSKPLKGGEAPKFSPGAGIAKQMVESSKSGTSLNEITSSLGPEEATQLKAVDVEAEAEEEEKFPVEDEEEDVVVPEDEEEESDKSDIELKSLLKDIKGLLEKNVHLEKEVASLKKSVETSVTRGIEAKMKKLGFNSVKPDVKVRRLGIESHEELKKSTDKDVKPENVVSDLSKMSWRQLANLRVDSGDLKPFSPWYPTEEQYAEKK